MHLDLTDEETSALLNLLAETIRNDRYPLSPRVRTLRGILAKLGPMAPRRRPDRLHRSGSTRTKDRDRDHGGGGNCRRGVSSSRINLAHWRRRRLSAGLAVVSCVSISSSIRGSVTVSGTRGLSR
jgi:hypothetical protein